MGKLPHVTQILSPWIDKTWMKEEDLRRGGLRHKNYAAHLLGVWAPPIDPKDQGQLDSFRRWADKYIVKVWFVEKYLEDKDAGYGGTIEFSGELTICPGTVIDWKPPAAGGPVTRAQVTAYLNLAQKNKFKAKRGGYLRMDPEGGVAKMVWVENFLMDFNGFLSCLNSFRYMNS